MEIEQLSREEWGEALPSSGFEVFHTPAALGVLEEHTAGELKLYGGFRATSLSGCFPSSCRTARSDGPSSRRRPGSPSRDSAPS